MKKLKLFSLAILLSFVVIGFAFAAQIPDITQPSTGNESWSMQVHNNSGAALDDGDVVIWDIDSSTGDDDMYITTTSTKGTGPIAGVVKGSIAIGDVGTIVVYGYATVDTVGAGEAGGRGTPMTTSGTTGSVTTDAAAGNYILGDSVVATSSGSTIVFVNPGRF